MTTHFPAVDNGRTRKRLSLPRRTILAVSLAMGFFLIYPNIAKLLQGTHAEYLQNGSTVGYVTFFVFRYLYFSLLCYILLKKGITEGFETKIYRTGLWTFGIAVVAYLLYVAISYISDKVLDWFSVILLFQFMTMWAVCTLMGYAYSLYAQKLEREQEIEQLRLDNLQSQYEALTNQVNPHFFSIRLIHSPHWSVTAMRGKRSHIYRTFPMFSVMYWEAKVGAWCRLKTNWPSSMPFISFSARGMVTIFATRYRFQVTIKTWNCLCYRCCQYLKTSLSTM
ncbi:hypothetical protein QT327_16355 [Olivibacter sp. 47]|nr:hypothetical protein [Olivibacter sp. 47]MDM8175901.1 hypothetical protein [Olivibacter sp. 47]